MQINLDQKTALVTGSTAGIGFAIAQGLAAAGATVIINGRTPERVDAAVERLQTDLPGAKVSGIAADAATTSGCAKILTRVPQTDILINNLGVFTPHSFFDILDDEWNRVLETNLLSGMRLSRALLPPMMEQGWGRIVFISSVMATMPPTAALHYGVSKAAQLALSRGLAKIAGNSGVTVNSVLPALTLSDGVSDMITATAKQTGQSDASVTRQLMAGTPTLLNRPATVTEVANMVVYLCSPQASATTGAALRVDGGAVDSIL